MALDNRLTEDELRQRAQTSRMRALYSPTQRRESGPRPPAPPAAAPALEQQRPSTAGATVGAIQAGTALGSTVAGMINPLLGMFVGILGGGVATAVGRDIAEDEGAEAAQVAHRNRRALGEAQREQQRYERDFAASQRPVSTPGPLMPQGQQDTDDIAPGAVRRQQALLMG